MADCDRTLTLFIDSVDQLDDSNAGRRLDWLPVTGLSLHLRLVVSTLPDYPKEFQCLSLLRAKLQNAASQHSRMVEVETISEPEAVLQHLLRLLGRTLTEAQRTHVLEAFAKRTDADAAGTPLWLTIVAQAVAPWPSFGGIRFPIKPAVRELIVDLFGRLEMSHGRALLRAAFAYITLAKHGVSETELNHLLSLEDAVLADVYEWWVPPVRVIPPLLPTRLLTDLAPYLTRRGDGSGVELVTWYHRQFREAAHAWLFEQQPDGDAIKRQRHLELAEYFSGFWASADKPYTEALKQCVQRPRFFPGETAADRSVPHQPLVLEGDIFNPSSKVKLKLNNRRLHELVHHLIRSGRIDLVLEELMSPKYIAAKFSLGQGAALLREYAEAQVSFRQWEAAEAAHELAKCKATVGRWLKHLQQQPSLFALQICFEEPDQHPLCIAAKKLLRVPQGPVPRVLEWTNKPQQFNPCQLEIKEHTGRVNAVCYFEGAGNAGDCIASASEDGTIKITSAVSGDVVLELQGHDGMKVKSLAVCTDGTRMASGGEDNKVRVWDTATGTCVHVFEGHTGCVSGLSFPKDNKDLLASCSHDTTVRVWCLTTGRCLTTCKGHRCGGRWKPLRFCALAVCFVAVLGLLCLGWVQGRGSRVLASCVRVLACT